MDADVRSEGDATRRGGSGETVRAALGDAVRRYFESMDRGDVAGTVACFTEGATLSCDTNDMHLRGHGEIEAFMTRITANTTDMVHEVANLLVDVDQRRCAAELHYRNRRPVGPDIDMAVANFFDFDEEYKLTRVRFWTAAPIVPGPPLAKSGE